MRFPERLNAVAITAQDEETAFETFVLARFTQHECNMCGLEDERRKIIPSSCLSAICHSPVVLHNTKSR
ncbi:hypothetical protein BITS_1304 [Bifidobacterium tsurumiense]|uniref:Uncharacterized protein n=1 Tax=Bifidobacterium tsurumiense TaxID=356829 RepID=A0A087E9I8_9BIFI|nr:hypothetical protein BITS_1304 [Bifidobacterium tsurumiense]